MNSGCPSQRLSDPRALDPLDHSGVEADTGVEAEVAAVHLTETDRTKIGGVDARGEVFDGIDRVVRQADRASEHVGRPAGQHTERRVGAGDAGGDFVERAVTAETDHDVDAPAGGVVSETGGVTAPVGLDDLDVVTPAEATVDDHRVRAVTDDAKELTTSRIRKPPTVPRRGDDFVTRVWAQVDAPVTWNSL